MVEHQDVVSITTVWIGDTTFAIDRHQIGLDVNRRHIKAERPQIRLRYEIVRGAR